MDLERPIGLRRALGADAVAQRPGAARSRSGSTGRRAGSSLRSSGGGGRVSNKGVYSTGVPATEKLSQSLRGEQEVLAPSAIPPSSGGKSRSPSKQQAASSLESSQQQRRQASLPKAGSGLERSFYDYEAEIEQREESKDAHRNIFDEDSDDESNLPTEQWTLRDRLYAFFDQPRSSKLAFTYMAVIFICIIVSVLNFLIESLPEFYGLRNNSIFVVESIIVFIFTFDYLSKFILTRLPRWKWMIEFLNVIDLVSILPYFVELVVEALIGAGDGLSAFVVVRILRLFRVFRIFKVAKYFKLLRIVAEALRRSTAGFILLLFTLVLALVLFSSMEFYAEQTVTQFDNIEPNATRIWYYATKSEMNAWVAAGRPNRPNSNLPGLDESDFQSVPDSMWWCLVTITTVGYGDRVPRSPLGKAVASAAVVAGLLVLAFPLTIMGSNFNEVYAESLAADIKKAAKRARNHDRPALSREEAMALLERDFVMLRNQALDLRRSVNEVCYRCDEVETLIATVIPAPGTASSASMNSMRRRTSSRDMATLM